MDIRPDKTVFFYANDAAAAAKNLQDPVVSKSVESMQLQIKYSNNVTRPENMNQEGSLSSISEYARMDIYKPKNPNGKMVLVCPGGSYFLLATYNEGIYVADWMLKQGVTVAVLKHRLPNGVWQAPLEDVSNAFKYARTHAKELGIEKVGIIGFSAGGHLAASATVLYDSAESRPDFSILVYPVVTLDKKYTHSMSRDALIGSDAYWNNRSGYSADEFIARQAQRDALVEKYSCEKQVTADTPPVFMTLCYDDSIVVPQNSLQFYQACVENKVPAEIHIFPKGGHGWGFNLKEYNMNDPIDYCRSELLNSLSRWLKGLDEMEAARKAAAEAQNQRGMQFGGARPQAPTR
ncbi:MAG: alpha/beta hydrolase [Bacteroidales bacterium]|nr:alpha/beta hydrolase [Bacteroidales bacterium]